MLNSILIQQAAPTMAGLKSASLFSYQSEPGQNLDGELAQWNREYEAKGIKTIVLGRCKACPERVLLYTYRPTLLQKALQRPGSRELLAEYGYGKNWSVEQCLEKLSHKVCPGGEFPHEIGLFLDYPVADVVGFIQNKGKNCLCVGTWKVYSEPETARRLFRLYKHCSDVYRKCYLNGRSITQLIVAV